VSVTKDWWDRIYICFTGILIAVGIFGVRAAYKTLKAIEAQNAHIEKSANAALLNAQAVINSERPWIIVLPEKSNNGYRFRAINSGRTPADVISYSAEAVCMNSVKELPTEPVYGVEHKLLPKMLTPKDDSELLTIENFVDAVDECRRAEDRTTFPPTGTKIPVFYFRVVYTSPLYSARTEGNDGLPPYETRMCFYYSLHTGEGMVICGNENYNRQT
jgi:hypothetical protein